MGEEIVDTFGYQSVISCKTLERRRRRTKGKPRLAKRELVGGGGGVEES